MITMADIFMEIEWSLNIIIYCLKEYLKQTLIAYQDAVVADTAKEIWRLGVVSIHMDTANRDNYRHYN